MKGFFSFLLAIAILSAIFFSASAFSYSKSHDTSRALLLEKKYYEEQAIKHALLDSAKYAAQEAKEQYLLEIAAGNTPSESLEERIRGAVHARLASFSLPNNNDSGVAFGAPASYDEWDLVVWCGMTSRRDLEDTALASAAAGSAQKCPTCLEISNPACKEHIQVDELAGELSFGSQLPPIGGADGVLGFTLYNRKHGFASAAFIPKTKRVNY